MPDRIEDAPRSLGKVYLAGPMSGIPEFNFPHFREVAERLRSLGWEVVSPAELFGHTDKTWDWYMKHAITAMMTADVVYMLSGWSGSRGAKIEWNIAQDLGMAVYYEGDLS